MGLLLGKLAQYWQFRMLAVAAGVGLIVYAVVLPARSDNKNDPSMQTVLASRVAEADAPAALAEKAVAEGGVSREPAGSSLAGLGLPWLGENREAAARLTLAASAYDDADLPRDFSDSLRALRRDAEQGNVTAQFLLGHVYEGGFGVPEDAGETARWYGLARQGASAASGSGRDIPKDYGQALAMYRKAADGGDPAAELYVGLAEDMNGYGPLKTAEAARWYRKAAQQGSASAACNLGVLYHDGNGIPKDSVEAARWLNRAAVQGSAVAEYALGRMYAHGDGVGKDAALAAKWLEKAARHGSVPAQVMLSAMYATGEGVPGDTARAYMWINLASAREVRARDSRDELEKMIAPAEVAEGQRMTHAWLAQSGYFSR